LFVILLLALSAAAFSNAAFSAEFKEATKGGEGRFLNATADSVTYGEQDGKVSIKGNVVIESEKMKITTSEMKIDRTKKEILTENPLTLVKEELMFSGEKLLYNYESGTGTILSGRISFEGVYFYSPIVQITPDLITMNDVIASTCPCENNMDYHVSAKKVELSKTGKAVFKQMTFFFKTHKVFYWPTYSMSMASGKSVASGVPVGKWNFSSPSIGYAHVGGIRAGAGLTGQLKNGDKAGILMSYYLSDGLFTVAQFERKSPRGYDMSLRFGKEYKENKGYFRYHKPVIVWNEPTLEMKMPQKVLKFGAIKINGQLEAGRLKETEQNHAMNRAFANVSISKPISDIGNVRFHFIGDGRFGLYDGLAKYKVFGTGLRIETGDEKDAAASLEYLNFFHSGTTVFESDLVNTNDKLFGYVKKKVDRNVWLTADAEYDLKENRFEEIVFGGIRKLKCLEFDLNWRTEKKEIGMHMRILINKSEKK